VLWQAAGTERHVAGTEELDAMIKQHISPGENEAPEREWGRPMEGSRNGAPAHCAGSDRGAVSRPARRGGSRGYEQWSKQDLYERARELGIEHRSRMSKTELIEALRHG